MDDDGQDADMLDIRNYVENKHSDSIEPTLKQIQGRMKNSGLTCLEVKGILQDLGYEVEDSDEVALSNSRVFLYSR